MSLKSETVFRDIRGFILAAGFGTRLLPLTEQIPKALVPFMDGVLSDCALSMFEQNGVTSIGINGHHHMDQIEQYAGTHGITLFREPEILGTGGYLKNLGTFFDRPMLVVNCDAVFPEGNKTMNALIQAHLKHNLTATLVLRHRAGALATGISLEDHRIRDIGEGPFMFTGMYMVSPQILSLIESPGIVPAFQILADSGQLGAVVHEGSWFDAGTREGLIAAHQEASGTNTTVYKGADVHPSAQLISSVIYPGCHIGAEARVENSVLMNETISANDHIQGVIRG